MTDVKIYPLMRDIIKAMMKHLPDDYYGSFTYTIDFRDGKPYSVTDVYGTRTLDMKELK